MAEEGGLGVREVRASLNPFTIPTGLIARP